MAPKTQLPPSAFFTTLLHLLSQEQASEVQETTLLLSSTPPTTLARAGLAIVNLSIHTLRTGLGGRSVAELGLDPAVVYKDSKGELPEHGIRTGDIVRVGEMPKGTAKKKEVNELKGKGVEGVVTRVGQRAVWVALGKDGSGNDDVEEIPDGKLWLVKLANDVTYKRMNQTLTKLLKSPESSYTTLQRVLLGLSSPGTADVDQYKDMVFFDSTLNPSQQDAIRFALSSPELALIHGPPGTGKTYTLIELILQLLKQGQRVLVCGPSNISVDNIVERLALTSPSTPIVRLGHPARLLPSVVNHSLEVLTRTSEAAGIVNDVRKEMDEKQASIKKTRNGRERRAIYSDIKRLRKEYRERENKCIDGLVRGSKVVLSTLHGAGGRQVRDQEFDVVVIDEASQALEPQCWVPLIFGGSYVKKLVLAGDHLQLPPTVKSADNKDSKDEKKARIKILEDDLAKLSVKDGEVKAAKSWSLENTMFDRLLATHGSGIKRLLNTQYRMHEKIMRFPSEELYEGKLVAAESVKARLLKDLPYEVEESEDSIEPLVFFDTQGGDFPEKTEEDAGGQVHKSTLLGDSKSNEMEAAVVGMHVKNLVEAGVRDEDIAVVTPYNAQLSLLSSMLKEKYPNIELGSVDGFQGREKEAVVVSLVRSNAEKEVGFLAEKRRLNVAMTRPKRHLCVIGDSETVSRGSPFLKRWMKFLEDNADLRISSILLMVSTKRKMAFFQPNDWHEGEVAIHKRTHSDRFDNPTTPFLAPRYGNWIQRYPLMAIGTLDDEDRPWCTVWGSDQLPIAQPVAQSVMGVRTTVDASFDPVVQAIYQGQDDGEVFRAEGKGRLMSALSIHLEERSRVKLAGAVIAGALTASELIGEKAEAQGNSKAGKSGELQLVVKIDQSLGNCPKYLNKKHIVAHTPSPKLISESTHLTPKAIDLVHNADLFFIASAHKHEDMDCNHRGGAPGFIRVTNPENPGEPSTIVWPEYSGNNLYQTLGNLESTPHAGLVIPDFETGDVLYVTGDTETLFGADASKVIAKSTLAVKLRITGARFVENGLPFRGKLVEDSSQGRSPYNPRIRYLTTEKADEFGKTPGESVPTTAKLLKKTKLTPTITRYRFSLLDPTVFGPWKPGQYVAMDLSAEMDMGYSHMRDDDPSSLNDDYIRTFTVSSIPNSLGVHGEEFEVTVRTVGHVTKWLEWQRDGMCEIGIRGFGGEFVFEPNKRNAFVAAGIGITPLLGQMGDLDLEKLKICWSVGIRDVGLPLDILTQYPLLKDSDTTICLTGDESLLDADDMTKLQKLIDTGVKIQRRRIAREDLAPWEAEVDNWYLCTAPAMRKQVQEWLPGTVVNFENFDY
ncbi:hypothetical protein H2200_002511 [Cladophialophora chaetospira]|uniref:DNA helicase n=1 Tax=Cladophialophora chaetospira TaxID=386627 RepID=A0AA39CNM4_9EURO|nr:hypothetical protein H2200_002511 [Cladophialophora chaetospira]